MSKQELFLIVLTLGVFVVSLRNPFYGVSYFYLYYALEYNRLFISLRSLLKPLFVTPVIVLVSLIFLQKKKIVFAPQVISLAIFFLWMCLSRLMNGLGVWTGEEIDPFFKIVFFIFLVTNVIDTKEKLKFYIWIGIIVYAVLAYVARYNDMSSPYYFTNKNHFGFSIVGAIAFPIMFTMVEKSYPRKLEAVCYTMILLFALAGTNSRGAYLGLITIFVLLIFNDFNYKKIIVVALPVIFILTRISTQHWERFGSISTDVDQGGTGGQRIALWGNAIRMMFSNPIFGIGSGEAGLEFANYATLEEMARVGGKVGEENIKVHNMSLQLGAELGVIGLALFLFIIFLSIRDLWKARKLCKKNNNLRHLKYLVDGVGIAIIGLLITGQFGNYGYNLQFYMTVGLGYCVKSIVFKTQKNYLDGQSVDDKPVIPVKWEMPFRLLAFLIFAYMSLRL